MLVRETYLNKIRGFYDSNLVKILVWIRRCGKSVILTQIIDELKNNKKIDDNYPKYVISLDKIDLSRDGIIHLNLIDFLMGKKDI